MSGNTSTSPFFANALHSLFEAPQARIPDPRMSVDTIESQLRTQSLEPSPKTSASSAHAPPPDKQGAEERSRALAAGSTPLSSRSTPQVASGLLPRLFATLFEAQQDLDAIPPYPSPLFDVETIASKGAGIIAKHRIPRGQLLISEPPLVVWPQNISAEEARRHIDALPPQGREAFWSLGNAKPEGVLDEVLAIRATNGFSVELPPLNGSLPGVDGEAAADPQVASMVFPRIARFNHSCLPNADQAMNWKTLRMEVWATTDIEPGTEIAFEYTPLLQHPHAQRQSRLAELFAFTCRCLLCSSAAEVLAASDRRREEISRIVDELGIPGDAAQGSESRDRDERKRRKMAALERLSELVREEGYLGVPEFDNPAVSNVFSMYRSIKARMLNDNDNEDAGSPGSPTGATRARRESLSSVGLPDQSSRQLS